VPDGDEAVAVDQVVPAERMVRVHYRPGFRHSLARGAHGRALLAFCPAAQIDRVVADLGDADAVHRRLGLGKLLQLCVRDDAFLNEELRVCVCHGEGRDHEFFE
jgi:DNA-binding IclR family transcriptional regulator